MSIPKHFVITGTKGFSTVYDTNRKVSMITLRTKQMCKSYLTWYLRDNPNEEKYKNHYQWIQEVTEKYNIWDWIHLFIFIYDNKLLKKSIEEACILYKLSEEGKD